MLVPPSTRRVGRMKGGGLVRCGSETAVDLQTVSTKLSQRVPSCPSLSNWRLTRNWPKHRRKSTLASAPWTLLNPLPVFLRRSVVQPCERSAAGASRRAPTTSSSFSAKFAGNGPKPGCVGVDRIRNYTKPGSTPAA
jgi:hypothetical protein